MLRLARSSLVATALLAAACEESPRALPPSASSAAAPSPTATPLAQSYSERLSADTPRTTQRGAKFTAPRGWTITADASLIVLEPPELDSQVAFVDVNAASAGAAMAAAWAAYRPGEKHPPSSVRQVRPWNGWDERHIFGYERSPNQRLTLYSVALRHGKAWTVTIVEASQSTFGRRESQFELAIESLHPSGYVGESFAGKKALALDAERIKVIFDFVEDARKKLGVPGVAISLIDAGEVVFEGGFGVREIGKPAPVRADTLFHAASNTKPLTTLLLAKLVDEGKLSWDTPVIEVYPNFKLGDAETTRRVQIKHLVCACTGMPRQDLEWLFEYQRLTPQKTIDLLGTMQQTTPFEEVYQYNSLTVAAAGFIAGHVLYPGRDLGEAYDEAMRTRVFEPLGMKATTFDIDRAQRVDHARPHGDDMNGDPALATMDMNRSIIPLRPAGGAWSSVRDLSRYVQMELARGTLPDGKRYVSEENLLARRALQIASGADEAYGMGLKIHTAWGVPVVHHGGNMVGYRSDLFFLPEQGVGVVILTNSDTGEELLWPIMRRILEVLFDGRSKAVENVASASMQRQERIAYRRANLERPPSAAATAKLAVRYTNAALGELTIKKRGAAMVFDVGEWSSAVGSAKDADGTFSFVTIDPAKDHLAFVAGERDGERTLLVRDAQHEYVFTEVR